jgi:hypothetical protein
MPFALVHSPLLGPGSWAKVAAALPNASVPDLRPIVVASPPAWTTLRAKATELPVGAVVVGHSGAGAWLPLIGTAAKASALVFVDAVLPPASGAFTIEPEFRELLDDLAVDGILPPWTQWWGDDALKELAPDEADRHELDDAPRVPLSFCDEPVPVPDGWDELPCGYVRLSAAYDAAASEARRRGWPVVRRAGSHLDPVTRPADVVRALELVLSVLRW